MNRQDQIFFSALGGSLAVLVLGGIIATYGTKTTAPEWVQSMLTALAIAAAIGVPLWSDGQRRETRHHNAEIVVASGLRAWMRIASQEVSENNKFRGTGEQDGSWTIEIPEFAISLDQVASMRGQYARQVLSLIERRARRQTDIYGTRYYGDDTEALIEYYAQIAHLFWSARRIYQEIADARGLDKYTNRVSEVAAIKRGVEYAQEYRRLEQAEL